MRSEEQTGPAAGAGKPRLPARVFYGVIVAGVVLGMTAAALGGFVYLGYGEPSGRGVWGDVAKGFVVPVCAMTGATFGGLAGVALAAVVDRLKTSGRQVIRSEPGRDEPPADLMT